MERSIKILSIKEVSLGNDGSISMENLKIVSIMIWQIIMVIYVKEFFLLQKNCENKIPRGVNLNQNDLKLITT